MKNMIGITCAFLFVFISFAWAVNCEQWINSITYDSGSTIIYENQTYIANRFVYQNTPPCPEDDEWFWSPIESCEEPQGEESIEWQNNVEYNTGDLILYEEQRYVANRFVYQNTPPNPDDNEWFWSPSEYNLPAEYKPLYFRIYLKLSQPSQVSGFTRYVKFENIYGVAKLVAMNFTQDASDPLVFRARLDRDDIDDQASYSVLSELTEVDNRSFWDKMYLSSQDMRYSLHISIMKLWIGYNPIVGNTWNNFPDMMIGRLMNVYLPGWEDQVNYPTKHDIKIGQVIGRRKWYCDQFNITINTFKTYPECFKQMVFDLGKSGSSSENDPVFGIEKPKYHLHGGPQSTLPHPPFCSETISWYYYWYREWVQDLDNNVWYNFKDNYVNPWGIFVCSIMYGMFQKSGCLYKYSRNDDKWQRMKHDTTNLVTPLQEKTPRPGDYFHYSGGHSMMVAHWDAANHIMYYLDGPFPVMLRHVDLDNDPLDFYIGRIPSNNHLN